MTETKNNWYLEEVKFPGLIAQGSSNKMAVRRIQEWINLHRYYNGTKTKIEVDDDFGGITKLAIDGFQKTMNIPVTGECDQRTWNYLVQPMKMAFEGATLVSDDLRVMALNRAKMMLDFSPRELGQNCGPWVRAFMHGHDGKWAAWCAGSVSTIFHLERERALDRGVKNVPEIFKWSWSVPDMVKEAKEKNLYIDMVEVEMRVFEAGDLFVVFDKKLGYTHIGLVESVIIEKGIALINTIEGNTNDEGSAEGFELCRRTRSLKKRNIAILKIK